MNVVPKGFPHRFRLISNNIYIGVRGLGCSVISMSGLVVFYSRAGENYMNGDIRSIDVGNTEVAAGYVAKASGSDLFRLEQKVPYSDNYSKCTDEAKADQEKGVRPELVSMPDVSGYDTIWLGFPNYWGTMPMAVFTFLEGCDLKGKRIMPFCTHEGSGMGRSVKDIEAVCPDSDVGRALPIHGADAKRSEKEIAAWVKKASE